MAFETLAVISVQARQRRADELITGVGCVKIIGFSVGSFGFDNLDPTVALAPDPTALTLGNQVFPSSDPFTGGIEPYDSVENINPYTPVFVCTLQEPEAVGNLGELGIWATVTNGPDVGINYLHAIIHFPRFPKTATDIRTWRIILPN